MSYCTNCPLLLEVNGAFNIQGYIGEKEGVVYKILEKHVYWLEKFPIRSYYPEFIYLFFWRCVLR